jgi:hypothetical protein
MRLTGLLYFGAGVAAATVARAVYPQVKESLGPIAAAALAGAETAIADAVEAVKTAQAPAEASSANRA